MTTKTLRAGFMNSIDGQNNFSVTSESQLLRIQLITILLDIMNKGHVPRK